MASLADIAASIRSHRRQLGLTQQELAERSGVGRTRIADLENGRVPEMGVRTLLRLLTPLGLTLEVVQARPRRPTLDELRAETGE